MGVSHAPRVPMHSSYMGRLIYTLDESLEDYIAQTHDMRVLSTQQYPRHSRIASGDRQWCATEVTHTIHGSDI